MIAFILSQISNKQFATFLSSINQVKQKAKGNISQPVTLTKSDCLAGESWNNAKQTLSNLLICSLNSILKPTSYYIMSTTTNINQNRVFFLFLLIAKKNIQDPVYSRNIPGKLSKTFVIQQIFNRTVISEDLDH